MSLYSCKSFLKKKVRLHCRSEFDNFHRVIKLFRFDAGAEIKVPQTHLSMEGSMIKGYSVMGLDFGALAVVYNCHL